MKQNNIYGIILLSLCYFFTISCSHEEEVVDLIQPSLSSIEVEGEGGEIEITFANNDWSIAGVINKNGNVYIYGNTYTPEGKIIFENNQLQLDGYGKLEVLWQDKGFVIVRDKPASLTVNVKENYTGDVFSFALLLQSGSERKEITIRQKKSEGYQFGNITYFIGKGDGDSLYVTDKTFFTFIDNPKPMEITISPFYAIYSYSFFQSDDLDAFYWFKNDSIQVDVPASLYNGDVHLGGQEHHYTTAVTELPCDFRDVKQDVTIPAGNVRLCTQIQFRIRTVSYVLTMTNKRTKEKKTVEGKWVERGPTGDYTLKWLDGEGS